MKRHGFTLVELLVVIAIISILAAILLPTIGNALVTARVVRCANQQRQVYVFATFYASSYNGALPARGYGAFSRWFNAESPYYRRDGARMPNVGSTVYWDSQKSLREFFRILEIPAQSVTATNFRFLKSNTLLHCPEGHAGKLSLNLTDYFFAGFGADSYGVTVGSPWTRFPCGNPNLLKMAPVGGASIAVISDMVNHPHGGTVVRHEGSAAGFSYDAAYIFRSNVQQTFILLPYGTAAQNNGNNLDGDPRKPMNTFDYYTGKGVRVTNQPAHRRYFGYS